MASTLCNYLPEVLCRFPEIDDTVMRVARKSIDDSFKGFVRAYGNVIDAVTHPLQLFLNWLEALFVNTPWFIFLAAMVLIVYLTSRNMRIVAITVIGMLFIGFVGLW
ncbi:MAG: proline/glycine betaine ABC transporter permease, partial [Allorhizobium sp.]